MAIFITVPSALAQTNAAPSGPAAQSESPAAKPPEYDVASIKLNKSAPEGNRWDINFDNDHFVGTNISLKQLLQLAYQIKEDLISGISGPVSSEHFDIEAKVLGADQNTPVKLSDKQLEEMLIPLLEERFQLKAHVEVKNLALYELIVLKDGPKFKQAAADIHDGDLTRSKSSLVAKAVPMTGLASLLADQLQRTVIDKTGLTGRFDFTMNWAPDIVTDASADAGPSIFTAIQEQLGLKLQPAKGPVETLVVDHAEMPSAN
jgi:uncharacterized protein (TIGR03435 family)